MATPALGAGVVHVSARDLQLAPSRSAPVKGFDFRDGSLAVLEPAGALLAGLRVGELETRVDRFFGAAANSIVGILAKPAHLPEPNSSRGPSDYQRLLNARKF